MEQSTSRKEAKGIRKILKKRGVLLSIAVIFILAVVVGMKMRGSTAAQRTSASAIQTEEVTKRSLIKSVGATGKIVSVKSQDLSIPLTNIDVAEVKVQIGDSVTEGQQLLLFDTSDIEESLENAKTTLSTAEKKNNLSAQDAERNVEDAKRNESYQIDVAKSNKDTSYDAYQKAEATYEDAVSKLSTLKEAETSAKKSYQEAKTALSATNKVLTEKSAAVTASEAIQKEAKAAYETASLEEKEEKKKIYEEAQASYNEAKAAYEAALANYNTAQANVSTTEAAYTSAKTAKETQKTTISSLKDQVSSALAAYNTAVKSYDNTVASQASSVASATSSQTSVSLNTNTTNEQKQVEQYDEQLQKGTLLAPFDGIVTAVNYEQGDTYTQGTILTIQDCSAYEVEAEIDEYDISDIEVGQKVVIKTDATRDEELEGTVTFVSPTATSAVSATGVTGVASDVTYKVKIAINSSNNRLRLDMSASLSIIVEQHEDALTVPYNAVQEDEEGNKFVEVVEADGQTISKVPVTVVMESNYYTEIQEGAIEEGQKIKVVESENEENTFNFMRRGGGGF